MDTAAFKNLSILVVDDEAAMRLMLSRMLTRIGVGTVAGAEEGAAGIDAVNHAAAPFDVIICDLEMPTMNGFEFVRFLRMLDDPAASRTPVIILTGHASHDYFNEALSLGIHGFLTKPLTREKLAARIASALDSPPLDPKALRHGT